jgi:hypothetical protein
MPNFRLVLRALGLQGVKPVVYNFQFGRQEPAGVEKDYPSISDSRSGLNIAGENARTSWLGTPVFSDIMVKREGKPDLVLETVLIDVAMRKNIVTTTVQGRPGTVKEYVSDGDYEVRIRGIIVEHGVNAYPFDQVRDLHEVLRRSEAIPVVADYLRFFDIYNLVVTSYNFAQSEGFQNIQTFELSCISDNPEELIEENASPDI